MLLNIKINEQEEIISQVLLTVMKCYSFYDFNLLLINHLVFAQMK